MTLPRAQLRALINERCIKDADLDALTSDEFPEVYRRFTSGMDRTQKTTLLLDYADHAKLERALGGSPSGQASLPEQARSGRTKILFLAANPVTTSQLQLTREAREIEERIGVGKPRDAIELVPRWAVRAKDLHRALLEEEPQVVHFSGHGLRREQLVLEGSDEAAMRVEKGALVELIRILKGNIRLVVLNACFSEPVAMALVEHVDCAIGMDRPIGDEAAIAFAAAFYQALGFGKSVSTAFQLGCNEMKLLGIAEDQTPQLKVKEGVDPEARVLCLKPG
jgi:hypothetical protein